MGSIGVVVDQLCREFDGVACSEVGCERKYCLEWDHVDPIANGGVSSHENLKTLCPPHCWDKTHATAPQAGRGGTDGKGRAPPDQ